MPTREAQESGCLVDASVRKQFECEYNLTGRCSKKQRVGLPSEHCIDQTSRAPAAYHVIEWSLHVSKLLRRSPEEGRHSLRPESQAQSRRPTADVMDHRAVGQPDGDRISVGGDDHIRTAVGNDAVVGVGADALLP